MSRVGYIRRILLSVAAFLALGASLVSCSDEKFLVSSLSSSEQVNDSGIDLTYNTDVLVIGVDTLSEQLIPLNTDCPVQVKSGDGLVSFDCVEQEGKYYLRPKMLKSMDSKTILDKVTLTVPGNSGLDKEIYISVRSTEDGAATRAALSTDDPLKSRFGEIFAWGVIPGSYIGEQLTLQPIFDDTKITDFIKVNKSFASHTEYWEDSGNSVQEINNKLAFKIGVDKIPMKVITADASFGFSKEHRQRLDYQYFTRSRVAECSVASMDVRDDSVFKYIDPTLNTILNSDGWKSLKRYYGNDSTGIFNLLDDYGPYFATWCMIGARASYTMSKKQDLEMNSKDWGAQVGAALSSAQKSDAEILNMDSKQLAAYKYVNESNRKTNGNCSFNYSTREVFEQCDLKIHTNLVGGNYNTVQDMADFNAGEDPKKWVPLAYSGNGVSNSLCPLYDLVKDKSSERYKALKKYIDGDQDSVKAYCTHRKWLLVEEAKEESPWVLAGMILKVTPDGSAPTVFKAVCPDGKERMFYPMMMNHYKKVDNWYSDRAGKGLDTEIQEFGRCYRTRYHYWYYALAKRSEFKGLKNLEFVSDQGGHHINCMMPRNADTGDGWQCWTVDYMLVADTLSEADVKNGVRPITAFALVDDLGNVISSTGGSEYGFEAAYSVNYKKFWVDNDEYAKYRSQQLQPSEYGIYYLKGVSQPRYLKYMYSTAPLLIDKNDSSGNRYKIKVPPAK